MLTTGTLTHFQPPTHPQYTQNQAQAGRHTETHTEACAEGSSASERQQEYGEDAERARRVPTHSKADTRGTHMSAQTHESTEQHTHTPTQTHTHTPTHTKTHVPTDIHTRASTSRTYT